MNRKERWLAVAKPQYSKHVHWASGKTAPSNMQILHHNACIYLHGILLSWASVAPEIAAPKRGISLGGAGNFTSEQRYLQDLFFIFRAWGRDCLSCWLFNSKCCACRCIASQQRLNSKICLTTSSFHRSTKRWRLRWACAEFHCPHEVIDIQMAPCFFAYNLSFTILESYVLSRTASKTNLHSPTLDMVANSYFQLPKIWGY